MIKMSYPDIVAKIRESNPITQSEIEERIKKKMDMLSGLISKEGAAYIVANELGVKLVQTTGILKIKDVLVGMRSVETAGKVMRKFPINEFERNGKAGKVGSFMIADESGQIRVTAWHDMTDILAKFKEGDIIKIVGGYVRENNGSKEIHLNSNSKIAVNPEGITINVQAPVAGSDPGQSMPQAQRKKISDLAESDSNVEIFGHVVQVFDPRFWPACPECNKKLEQVESGFRCAQHGSVEPVYAFVLNAFVDDGSDNIRVVFFTRQALNLLKVKEEDMQAYRAEPERFEKLKTDLLGEQVKVIGGVSRNEMFDRLELRARLVFRDIDPDSEISRLKKDADAKPAEKTAADVSDKDIAVEEVEELISEHNDDSIPTEPSDDAKEIEKKIKDTDDEDDPGMPPEENFEQKLPSIDDI